MHIRPIRFLEVDPPNAKYDLKRRLYKLCTNVDQGNYSKIERTIATNNNKDDDKENP